MAPPRLRQRGALFVDADGGQVMLRGVNLGGDCKVPWPHGGTDRPSDFADHREVSFIGRPFPLDEADEHLGRLAHWGFNVLRLLTTWEAVEHRGPGLYDEAYLDYFAEVARRAGEHGLRLFVDFHQDVWSRMTGGDGAPGWLFDALGLDFTAFDAAGAAHVMQARYDYDDPAPRQLAYPQMSWGSNYKLPANGILWSLFWGGRLFTPDFRVGGENVKDFLQGHYLGAMGQMARRLADLPNVLGFDTLNEPGLGWMGQPLTWRHTAPSKEKPERPRVGPALSPLDCLAIARGVPTTVPVLARDGRGVAAPTGEVTLNPGGVSIWKAGAACPFEAAGAYRMEVGAPRGLDEDFFRFADGRALSLSTEAFAPFFHRVAATIRRRQPDWSVFAELDPFARSAGRVFPRDLPEHTVNASHWYDPAILYRKRFDPRDHYCVGSGERERGLEVIAARFAREMGALADQAKDFPGGAPTLIGEFGIPFDLEEGAAYQAWAEGRRDGVWNLHEAALSAMYDALDLHGLHSTLWNYTAS
ncbi:MAG: cellulase family glycosylhydrolase, partial [Caulobacteraceae bacterium]